MNITTIKANMHPRYWEDAYVNGVEEDDDNPTIPRRIGDSWSLTINNQTGQIADWPADTKARVHYKVCDAGFYEVWDNTHCLASLDGYVPSFMSPNADGSGDYVIMDIDSNGFIKDWQEVTERDVEDWE